MGSMEVYNNHNTDRLFHQNPGLLK